MPKALLPASKALPKGVRRSARLLSDLVSKAPSSANRTNPFEDVIEVTVGPDRELFRLHKCLLIADSSFFAAALCDDWAEAKTGAVDLPEEDPTAFDLYALSLYSRPLCRTLDTRMEKCFDKGAMNCVNATSAEAVLVAELMLNLQSEVDRTEDQTAEQRQKAALAETRKTVILHAVYTILINVYILGEHLQSETFCNETIDILLNVAHGYRVPMPLTCSWSAFNDTPEGSALRGLVVHLLVFQDDGKVLHPLDDFHRWDRQPPELLASFVETIYDKRMKGINCKKTAHYGSS